MPLPSRPARTVSTEQAYKKRTAALKQRCKRELALHPQEQLDSRHFVGWLVTQKTLWSRPTWRQYKAAVVYVLEVEKEKNFDPIAHEALEALLPVDVEGCVPATRKTSGSKLKKFPNKDYKKLMQALDDHPSPWSMDLKRWLTAGLLTGLRPREWGQAKMIMRDGEPALLVTNAKATNQRAHGPTRTIMLGGLYDQEREIIKQHVERATQFAKVGQFQNRFYQGCAATLAKTARRIWRKREAGYVTLYSARHQFSADAKASGLLPEELAALMGHAVDTTATKHYGKKTAGIEMLRVRPDPKEVAKVRSVLKARFNGPGYQPMPKPAPVLKPPSEQT
jgi:hypothetical protein